MKRLRSVRTGRNSNNTSNSNTAAAAAATSGSGSSGANNSTTIAIAVAAAAGPGPGPSSSASSATNNVGGGGGGKKPSTTSLFGVGSGGGGKKHGGKAGPNGANNESGGQTRGGAKYLGGSFSLHHYINHGNGGSSNAGGSNSNNNAESTPIGAWVFKSVNNGYPPLWNEFRNNKTLCDAILKTVDGELFHVHRPILTSTCPFFKSILSVVSTTNNNLPGSSQSGDDSDEEHLLTIPVTFDSHAMASILDFVYTGQFSLTDANIQTLLPLVAGMELSGMLQQCCRFLLRQLRPDNCLQIYKLGKKYFCPKLQAETKLFILQNFQKVLRYPDFKTLEFPELEELLRDDLLNVKSEELVFDTIRQWIDYSPTPSRVGKLVELFQCIRFGLMTFSYFTTIVFNWRHVVENREVEESLFDASIFLTELDSRHGSDIDLNDPLARPRIPYQIIFAVGGWSAGSPTSFMETYDSRADRWFLTPGSDIQPRAYHGLVSVDNLIYMIGGFDGNDHFNTMRCYDPTTKVWTEKACMHFPRCYVSCCVLDGFIYALGGFNGRQRMSNVERYSVAGNQWEEIAPMSRQRSDASACSFNGKVYVAGGFNGQEVLFSVEVYDPKATDTEGQWSFIHPMHTPRSGVTLTVFRGYLYAIGGFNGFIRLATGERYNPADPTDWTPIANMSTPRSNFATVALDDMIFAIGGFNGATTIPYVECYDDVSNEWFDTTPMNLNRSALSACVLSGLPNAKEYSYLSRVQELLGLSDGTSAAAAATTTTAAAPP